MYLRAGLAESKLNLGKLDIGPTMLSKFDVMTSSAIEHTLYDTLQVEEQQVP